MGYIKTVPQAQMNWQLGEKLLQEMGVLTLTQKKSS